MRIPLRSARPSYPGLGRLGISVLPKDRWPTLTGWGLKQEVATQRSVVLGAETKGTYITIPVVTQTIHHLKSAHILLQQHQF